MWVEKTKTTSIERKTFIKGKFKGKFIGTLDEVNSDLKHENFYDIEIIEAEIFLNKEEIRHYSEGEHEGFINIMPFITSLPYYIKCNLSDNEIKKYYEIHLNDPKVRLNENKNSLIEKVIVEGETVFGDLVGEISGYILHYDLKKTYITVWEEDDDDDDKMDDPEDCLPTNLRTGKEERSGNYVRYQYHCQCFKNTYWGQWESLPEKPPFPWWIIGLLFCLFVFGPIISKGLELLWPILVFILGLFLVIVLVRVITHISRYISYIIPIAYILFLFFGVGSLFYQKRIVLSPKNDIKKDSVAVKKESIRNDSNIISHFRNWKDYKSNDYMGHMNVFKSDIIDSRNLRDNLNYNISNSYDEILMSLYKSEKSKLSLLYPMFDSIRDANNLSEMELAEVIVSCIQYIPYTLILNKNCDPTLYNDEFIKDYLNIQKGDCIGNVKFGILSPSEFLENLKGDCDTRTLMLFTILTHYGYDVAIFSSNIYKHSLLGINLPIGGTSKYINGRRYVLWETTAEGMPPGIIPAQIANTRSWYPTLLNK
jgi:hypothetical protein